MRWNRPRASAALAIVVPVTGALTLASVASGAHASSSFLAAGGEVDAVSTRTGSVVQTYGAAPGEDFGASLGVDTIIRPGQRDLVVGAPASNPDPGGGSPFGGIILFDPATGAELNRLAGDALPGGPVRRFGQSSTVLGHPTGAPLSWWTYGAPGVPEAGDVGTVIVTGDQAITEQYRIRGRKDALFGWRVMNLFEDIDGDSSRALDFAVAAPLETRKKKSPERGAVYVFSTLTSRQLYRIEGPHNYARFGYALTLADDHDGDGLIDFWVSAPGSAAEGVAGVVILLSSATGAEIRRIEAPAGAEQFGFAAASIFDLDGDGVRDLLVSAPAADKSARKVDTGIVFAFSSVDGTELMRWQGKKKGERLGITLASSATLAGTEQRILIVSDSKGRGVLDFFGLDGKRTRRVKGAKDSRFAQTVSGFVDLDGDGFPEFVMSRTGSDLIFVPE